MSEKTLINHAAPVWNVQPLQQHYAEADAPDDADDSDESTEEEGSESVDDSEDESGDDDDEDKELGPKGEKALAAIKEKHKAERGKRLAAERRIRELESEKESGGDEAAQERQRIEDEATAKANTRIIKAELKAAAAGKLLDPSDAVVFITDLDQFDVDDDGDVDPEAFAEAIADLIVRKPHLAAQSSEKRTPKPDRSQGAGGKGLSSAEQQFAAALGPLL
jgi:hypothetical protein